MYKLSEENKTLLRGSEIGLFFSHIVFSEFSAVENVMLPQLIMGKSKLMHLKSQRTHSFSFKKQACFVLQSCLVEAQRVAIARSLANSPSLILADEPTGNLDAIAANNVYKIIYKLVKSLNISCIFATHNNDLARLMDRKIVLKNGSIYNE